MATTLNQQISTLAQTVGEDVKALLANQGDLSTLTTTQKASLVVAINELNATLVQIDKNIIDDAQTVANKTWSSNKIVSEISTKCNEVKSALLGGAGEAYDTLKELADLITENKELIDSLQELAGAHVRYDAAQELSPEQKTQARTNIGAADDADYQTTKTQVNTNKTAIGTLSGLSTTAKTNLVSAINEVKTQADKGVSDAATAKSTADTAQQTATAAQTAASTAQSDVDALEAAIGATDTNFAKVYTDARDGASE